MDSREDSVEEMETTLTSAPSFSIYNTLEDEDKIGEALEKIKINHFSFEKTKMGLIEEEGGVEEENEETTEPRSPPMYLATGLGICNDAGGEVIDFSRANPDENGNVDEEYYKRMLDEYPCHPLLLRYYAIFLQSKGDLNGAEDYYHRAILADPGDSVALMLYAKLIWELYHDRDRVLHYFELAAHAAPQDSDVLAAYASFLWEIEDHKEDEILEEETVKVNEDMENKKQPNNNIEKPVRDEDIESVSRTSNIPAEQKIDRVSYNAADARRTGDPKYYLKWMVYENPENPSVLKVFAHFLSQFKGDLHGAEEYYSRAIQVDPTDGEILSLYAKLVWDLHHDHDKALCYFEQAIEASPTDSYVLGAYASFLWETEIDD